MNVPNLLLGINHVSAQYVEEARTVIRLKPERKRLSPKQFLGIAAVLSLVLFLLCCTIYALEGLFPEDTFLPAVHPITTMPWG